MLKMDTRMNESCLMFDLTWFNPEVLMTNIGLYTYMLFNKIFYKDFVEVISFSVAIKFIHESKV